MSIDGAPGGPLSGRRVIVTRPVEDSAELVCLLERAGAEVLAAPAIRIELAPDALVSALAAGPYDWVVVTSANGVRALAAAGLGATRLAVVGPATADAALRAGLSVALQPPEAMGVALVDAFADAPPLGGRVLVAQADRAGIDVADGLRAKGWHVDPVIAYRTVDVGADAAVAASVAAADAITFLSGSAARSFVGAYGVEAVPPVVACIGPSTATVCRQLGLRSPVVAAPHTVLALVRALIAALDP